MAPSRAIELKGRGSAAKGTRSSARRPQFGRLRSTTLRWLRRAFPLPLVIAGISACSGVSAEEFSVRDARVYSGDQAEALLPESFLDNEGLRGRVLPVGVRLDGLNLKKLLARSTHVGITYIECDTGKELDASLGPFLNREFLGSAEPEAIDQEAEYEIIGTIAAQTARHNRPICLQLFSAPLVGRRTMADPIRLERLR